MIFTDSEISCRFMVVSIYALCYVPVWYRHQLLLLGACITFIPSSGKVPKTDIRYSDGFIGTHEHYRNYGEV